jgi:hypothetical protein
MLVSDVIGGTIWEKDKKNQLNKLLQNYGRLRYFSVREKQSALYACNNCFSGFKISTGWTNMASCTKNGVTPNPLLDTTQPLVITNKHDYQNTVTERQPLPTQKHCLRNSSHFSSRPNRVISLSVFCT